MKAALTIAILLPFYWGIGVVVSVIDKRMRDYLINRTRWHQHVPTNIKPERIIQFWAVYLVVALFAFVYWLFADGGKAISGIINSWLNSRRPNRLL